MRIWRLCRRPFADLSGDGARLYGGRWNSPGRPMVYAAESAALAADVDGNGQVSVLSLTDGVLLKWQAK